MCFERLHELMWIDDMLDYVECRDYIHLVLLRRGVERGTGHVQILIFRQARARRAGLQSLPGPSIRQSREKNAIATSHVENSPARNVLLHYLLQAFIELHVSRIVFLRVKVSFAHAVVCFGKDSVFLPCIRSEE